MNLTAGQRLYIAPLIENDIPCDLWHFPLNILTVANLLHRNAISRRHGSFAWHWERNTTTSHGKALLLLRLLIVHRSIHWCCGDQCNWTRISYASRLIFLVPMNSFSIEFLMVHEQWFGCKGIIILNNLQCLSCGSFWQFHTCSDKIVEFNSFSFVF